MQKPKTSSDEILVGFVQGTCQSAFAAEISDATYSCDSQLVDGSVNVLDGDRLAPGCRLTPPLHTPRGESGYVTYTDMI